MSSTLPPLEALRQWMFIFVDSQRSSILLAVNLITCGPEKVFEQSGPLISTAIDSLMHRAGELEREGIRFVNAAYLSERYEPKHPAGQIRVIDL